MRKILMAGLLGLAPAAALAQDAPGPTSPIDKACFEAAQDGLLSDKKADWLCMGASSSAPHECYVYARKETTLGREEAIELCRCAEEPKAPVTCFESELAATTTRANRVLEMCRPIAKRRLLDNCAPLTAIGRERATKPYALPSQ